MMNDQDVRQLESMTPQDERKFIWIHYETKWGGNGYMVLNETPDWKPARARKFNKLILEDKDITHLEIDSSDHDPKRVQAWKERIMGLAAAKVNKKGGSKDA